MKKERKTETMTDSLGREVPLAYVSKWDKQRDREVRAIYAKWQAGRVLLENLMSDTLARFNRLTAAREAETGAAVADKGNVCISTFDGLVTVQIRQNYRLRLDERVAAAKGLMIEFALGLVGRIESGETKEALRQIIESAFAANKAGMLPVAKIAGLKKMDIRHPKWQQALKLLNDAENVERGKRYVGVAKRMDREHDPVAIRLDIADCWPATAEAAEGDKDE